MFQFHVVLKEVSAELLKEVGSATRG